MREKEWNTEVIYCGKGSREIVLDHAQLRLP